MTERRLVISGHEIDISFLEKSDLVEGALALAQEGHQDEVRKIRGEPFITHPIGVARIVSEYYEAEARERVQALSLVHDIVDSTMARERVTMARVREVVGVDLALGVLSLSKSLKITDDRLQRLDYLRMRRSEDNVEVQAVAAGDKIHNIEMAIEELQLVGDAFWRRFKGGKAAYTMWPRDVLREIVASGALFQHPILDRYESTLNRFYQVADIDSVA